MSEKEIIDNTPSPRTRESLAHDLRQLGLEAGITVLMHSSLSALGWVAGGSVAVVQALMDVVTPGGTIVMPTFTAGLTDPAKWQNPPVPTNWVPIIRALTPAFDPRVTPTRGMGQIVETFRIWPGVRRSEHPVDSFAAWGRYAEAMTAEHQLNFGLGESSPLARLYDRDGWVLLLGVGYGNNTSFHLAEYRAAGVEYMTQGAPIVENGQRVWKSYQDVVIDDEPFPEIGAAFEQSELGEDVRKGKVGSADARLFRQRLAVDFALAWLRMKRRG